MASKSTSSKSKKGQLSQRSRLLLSLLMIAILLFAINYFMGDPAGILGPHEASPAWADAAPTPQVTQTPQAPLTGALDVYVLDVGQGDSIFLRGPSGKTMLIDASISSAFGRIDAFLQAQGVTKLDVVVATHPHADHIGGMKKVVDKYEIGACYMPDVQTQTKTFENLLDALIEKEVPVIKAVAGADSFIPWDDAVEIRILSPFAGVTHKDLNDASILCRARVGDTAIMLTGDAEATAEQYALNELPPAYFKAVILKLGHHGSSSSTSDAFLRAVQPEVAIASLGEDNTYGHPHTETLEILEAYDIPLYRTDIDGTIHVRLDGETYTIETER